MEKNRALIQDLVSYIEKNLQTSPQKEAQQMPGDHTAEYIKGEYTGRDARNLKDLIRDLGETFHEMLFRKISESGLPDAEVYKKANLDRKLFSKIRCSYDYIPKKKTIIALAIALRLNLDDTRDLLASAGYALSDSSKTDLIVRFCIENGIYDIYEVNALLFEFDQPVLA